MTNDPQIDDGVGSEIPRDLADTAVALKPVTPEVLGVTPDLQLQTRPKLALLFLTRGDVNHPSIWEEFTNGFENEIPVFLHAKYPDSVHSTFLQKARRVLSIETRWGDISLVRASILLLKTALVETDATHFALLSESCVPIKPTTEILRQLTLDGRSRISWTDCHEMAKPHRERCFRAVDIGLESWLHQHQWMILNREAAEVSTEEDITARFEAYFAPDENYFITILKCKGYPLIDRVSNTLTTWVEWNVSTLTTWMEVNQRTARNMEESPAFFARKFHPDSDIGEWQLHVPPGRRILPACKTNTPDFSKSEGSRQEASISAMDGKEILEILTEFLASDLCVVWLVDPQVLLDHEWNTFQSGFITCDADLLATEVRTRAEDPQWQRWESLSNTKDFTGFGMEVAALLPLLRLSRSAAEAILKGVEDGWTGHAEVLIPTLVNRAGLHIEDIGGAGSFTPPERIGRWYNKQTWHWYGPVEHGPGLLHFPVALQRRPLASARVVRAVRNEVAKMLYVAPTGASAKDLLPRVLKTFLGAGADCLLLQYDGAEMQVPDGVRIIRDRGYKFPLAIRHLPPEAVAEYDYIFFWDDDLGVTDFDPKRFVRIMEANRLAMAQPAIHSPHGLSHAITKYRPCPPPWRDPDGTTVYPVVGRLTNFVEIMAPVFTREAWQEFYGYLNAENRSGWGYDYIPLGRKGIVDALPVVHARAVQSINGESQADMRRFLDNQGLFRHQAVDHGLLYE